MFKRTLLVLTFIAAFSTIGIGLSNHAHAWRGGYYGRPYGAYYAPRVAYYPAAVPYRAYYGYGPRVVRSYYYAAPSYPVYYAAPAYPVYYDSFYGGPGGVSVSFGF